MRKTIYIIGVWLMSVSANAQERSLLDSLHYRAELQATLASGDHNPLWLNANKYGLSSLKKTNGYLRGALERPLSTDDGRKWGLGYGADLAVASGFTSKLIVQQAFVEGRWLKGTLTVGSKEYPMELKNNQLSSGSQALGINARPVPQVRLALPDYWTIPSTKSWLALKGHIAYGKTTDDNWQKDFTHQQSKYTEGTLYHSKAGYLRIGPKNITLEVGLEMACQFGGKSCTFSEGSYSWLDNGSGLKDFLYAFVPGTGSDVVEDKYKNSEGNHLGSWGGRLNLNYPKWNLGLYGEHFYEDHSSMYFLGYYGYGTGDEWDKRVNKSFFVYQFKDMLLGAELTLKRLPWLRNIVCEYLYTKYQSGPVYHDHTISFPDQIGGVDEFYNHYIFTGWQHWGQVMGNPLYLSPLYNDNAEIKVKNNRFMAFHLGLSGEVIPRLGYRILATWQDGLGTYKDPYTENKHSGNLLVEASYTFPQGKLSGWGLKGAYGADFGNIRGDNQGFQLTIIKTGIIRK